MLGGGTLIFLIWAALLMRMIMKTSPHHLAPSVPVAPPAVPHCDLKARVIWAQRVVLPKSETAGAVHISANGQIAAAWACERDEALRYSEVRGLPLEELGPEEVVSPGLVDAAAHLAEWLEAPGRSYEGFSSGTQAAAAGGVTTVVDLPAHTRPLATSAATLQRHIDATHGQLHVDVGFWGAALPGTMEVDRLRALLRHGALGLSAVVAAAPVVREEERHAGAHALTPTELELVIDAAAPSGKPVLVHAEMVSDDDAGLPPGSDGMDHASWLATRPLHWEESAIRLMLFILAAVNSTKSTSPPRIHVHRLSDAGTMPLLRASMETMPSATSPEGVSVPRLTVGSCPHYTMFDAEHVVRGDTRLKVAPPLRSAANRRRLWTGLVEGTLSMLSSDHTPATLEDRAGSFLEASTGISGIQFMLPATWTEGLEHGVTLTNLSRWLSEEPAKLVGVWRRKGSIEAGKDADLVVWRPEASTNTAAVFHRQPGSPYEDLPLAGRVVTTYVRGRIVFRDGSSPLSACGEVILGTEVKGDEMPRAMRGEA